MANIQYLEQKAKNVRCNIIEMIGHGKAGHFGGSCSIADIATALYFYKMNHNPKNPAMKGRDIFILSKGHSAPAQYACLAEAGYFDKTELKNLKKLHTRLQGHPDVRKLVGIEGNTGSLGQGLSIAAGIASAFKMDGINSKVYSVVGDGELQEGQIWEAAMAASKFKLDNLVAIIDNNGLQATDFIDKSIGCNNIKGKFESFGWTVIECDGHNMKEIVEALDKLDNLSGAPVAIIAHTVKGKGIACAENNPAFHNGTLTKEQYEQLMEVYQ
ncbi:MAG TPA: transketolase [Clostridia bacterium]|nr:transketolase [Clostridia bacterium]